MDMMGQTVENRKVILKNKMLEQWGFIGNENGFLSQNLKNTMQTKQADVSEFLKDDEMQKAYLDTVFSECIDILQKNDVTGIFLVLANAQDTTQAAQYNGFFVRDSDPAHQSATNTDLLMERGSKNLARTEGISLDSAWATRFSFAGNGVRTADDFFYQPYLAARENAESTYQYLGYWAEPFILEDYYMDSH